MAINSATKKNKKLPTKDLILDFKKRKSNHNILSYKSVSPNHNSFHGKGNLSNSIKEDDDILIQREQ